MKKYLIVGVFLTVLIAPNLTFAQTAAELQTQIQALLAQIAQLRQQLANLQPAPVVWCHDFNVNLKIGDTGSEVEALHSVLEKEKITEREFWEVKEGVHYFGEVTASVVSGFQEKYKDEVLKTWGLQYGTGFVGATTRVKLNKLYGCGVKQTPPPFCSSVAIACESNSKMVCPTGLDDKGCPFPCKCVPVSTPTLACIDSDNGVNSYQKGITSGYEIGTKNNISKTDYCFDSNKVVEFFCGGPNSAYDYSFVNNSVQNCSYGCYEGACKQSATTTPSITVLSPNGGEVWQVGSTQTIKWNSVNVSKVSIWLCKSGVCGRFGTIPAIGIPNTGSYSFSVSASTTPFGAYAPASDLKIRVASEDNYPTSTIYDDSDAPFSIVAATTNLPDLTVTDLKISPSPVVGEFSTFLATVSNIGSASANNVSFTTDLGFQANLGSSNPNNTCLNGMTIAAGSKCTIALNIKYSSAVSSNAIKVQVDLGNQIQELNESNNSASISFPIMAPANSQSNG